MLESTFSEVERTVAARRGAAATENNKLATSGGAKGFRLCRIADHDAVKALFDKQASNEETFAVAWLLDSNDKVWVIASVKGGSQERLAPVVKEIAQSSNADAWVVLVNNTTGLHAEMQIVRYCLNELGVPLYDLNLKGMQVACIGKPVCRDCAGWLNQHYIGHLSVAKNDDGEVEYSKVAGDVSTMGGGQWMDPASGGIYIGGNDVYCMQRPGQTTVQRL
jgi:hypothetical protein